MSKVGKKPIIIPQGVVVKTIDGFLEIQGKEGSLKLLILPHTTIASENNMLIVNTISDEKQARANWGTMRALAQNAVTGVNTGFIKILEIKGVGYRALIEGDTLVLYIGFSHPVKFQIPKSIKIVVEKNIVKIFGVDKNLVGETAAKIRALKKPEPYKGKGIRYKDEIVQLKPGKKTVSTTT